jgi:hypothetical protein
MLQTFVAGDNDSEAIRSSQEHCENAVNVTTPTTLTTTPITTMITITAENTGGF